MKKTVIRVLAGMAALALFGLVGSTGYEEQKAQESFYCEMVKAGHWPAYKDSIECDK